MTTSKPNNLPKAPPPNPITLVGWVGREKYSIHNRRKVKSMGWEQVNSKCRQVGGTGNEGSQSTSWPSVNHPEFSLPPDPYPYLPIPSTEPSRVLWEKNSSTSTAALSYVTYSPSWHHSLPLYFPEFFLILSYSHSLGEWFCFLLFSSLLMRFREGKDINTCPQPTILRGKPKLANNAPICRKRSWKPRSIKQCSQGLTFSKWWGRLTPPLLIYCFI